MELEVFAGQEKSELSMIEVARAILEERGRDHEMYFSDLVNEIQNYLEKSDAEIRVNAFMDGDEDAIDYSDDDPEDEDFTPESSDLEYDEENPDDEKSEVESYDSEINEIIPDEDLDEEVDINEEDDEDDDLDEE